MKLTVIIPDEQYEQLEATADYQNMTPSNLIAKALPVFLSIDTRKPFVLLNGDQLNQLTPLFNGTLIRSSEQLLDILKRRQTIDVEGLKITLDGDTLVQVEQAGAAIGQSLEEYLPKAVMDGIYYTLGVPQPFTV